MHSWFYGLLIPPNLTMGLLLVVTGVMDGADNKLLNREQLVILRAVLISRGGQQW